MYIMLLGDRISNHSPTDLLGNVLAQAFYKGVHPVFVYYTQRSKGMVGNQQNKLEMFLDVQWDYIPINSSQ